MDHNRRAAKGRHGKTLFLSWTLKLFYSFFFLQKTDPLSLLLTFAGLALISSVCFFLASHLSLLLSHSLPNSSATLHCLSTHLRLTAISSDVALKDQPGTVNQTLLAPLRAMEMDQSLDTSVSDGGG